MSKYLFYILFSCILLAGCGWGIEQLHPAVSTRPPDALFTPLQGQCLSTNSSFDENENIFDTSAEKSGGQIIVYEEVEIRSDEAEDVSFLSDLQPQVLNDTLQDPSRIVPIETNDQVKFFLNLFQGVQKPWIARSLRRAGRYTERMQRILRESGLPEDLVYLALIESGFNPHAYSRAGAVGIWQFIPSTGRRYGLVINWWIDERRDLEKSTRAAARYLKDLYEIFGDWYLAAAAYNAGEGKLKRAIKKYKSNNFWDLAQFKYLKKETKNYIPRFLAALMIAKDPGKYGFDQVIPDPPLNYETVSLSDATDLAVIAKGCGCDLKSLIKLNPQLRRGCTPPGYSDYEILIPRGTKEQFQTYYDQLPASKRLTFRRHKIKRGETLSNIALTYDISVKSIMKMNRLNNRHRIREGKSLIIPLPTSYTIAKKSGYKAGKRKQKKLPDYSGQGYRKLVHQVAEGDSLWRIGRLYGVSVSSLQRWNLQGKRAYIRPGQKIVVWLKERPPNSPQQTKKTGDISEVQQHIWYTVKPGDNLWLIAKKHKVTIAQISRWNDIDIRKPIRPGLRLRIFTNIHYNAGIEILSPIPPEVV